MVYKFLEKKISGGAVKSEIMSNKELRKPIIRKLEKRKRRSFFMDNIWDADLEDMQFISKFDKGYRLLLIFIANMHGLFL